MRAEASRKPLSSKTGKYRGFKEKKLEFPQLFWRLWELIKRRFLGRDVSRSKIFERFEGGPDKTQRFKCHGGTRAQNWGGILEAWMNILIQGWSDNLLSRKALMAAVWTFRVMVFGPFIRPDWKNKINEGISNFRWLPQHSPFLSDGWLTEETLLSAHWDSGC